MQGGGRVQDGDGDFGNDGGDNDGVALRAGNVCEHGEDNALEEGGGLVECFLESIVEVHV